MGETLAWRKRSLKEDLIMDKLTLPVLVLNSAWQPIAVASVRRAFMKSFNGTAKLLDTETYMQYTFEEWCMLTPNEGDIVLRSKNSQIKVPEVLVLQNFAKFPEREVKLTRRNLLIRDGYRCQYTGRRISAKDATIDHVMPQSRGGTSTWENVVVACLEANSKKANRTPSEAGMKLLNRPVKPSWSPVYSRFSRIALTGKFPESWKKFVKNVFDMKDVEKFEERT